MRISYDRCLNGNQGTTNYRSCKQWEGEYMMIWYDDSPDTRGFYIASYDMIFSGMTWTKWGSPSICATKTMSYI